MLGEGEGIRRLGLEAEGRIDRSAKKGQAGSWWEAVFLNEKKTEHRKKRFELQRFCIKKSPPGGKGTKV